MNPLLRQVRLYNGDPHSSDPMNQSGERPLRTLGLLSIELSRWSEVWHIIPLSMAYSMSDSWQLWTN